MPYRQRWMTSTLGIWALTEAEGWLVYNPAFSGRGRTVDDIPDNGWVEVLRWLGYSRIARARILPLTTPAPIARPSTPHFNPSQPVHCLSSTVCHATHCLPAMQRTR